MATATASSDFDLGGNIGFDTSSLPAIPGSTSEDAVTRPNPFDPESQISNIQSIFQKYDTDNNGCVTLGKIGDLLADLGRDTSKAEEVIKVSLGIKI